MATVVVTGVAGALGQRVAARAADHPDVERVVGVDLVPAAGVPPKVSTEILDLATEDPAALARLAELVREADAVIHLAWRTAVGPRTRAGQAAASNGRALRNLLAAIGSSSPACVVHLSSATVYGAWPDNPVPLSEDAPLRPNPEFPFAVGKAEAERLVAELAERTPDTAVAVLRPAVTVGTPEPLYRALGGIRAPSGGDGARLVQYLHVDDLADAVVLAWSSRLRGVYNVAPDAGIPEDTARALAGGMARVRLPSRVAPRVAAWGWRLWRRGVPAGGRAYGSYPWVVAPDRLKAAGWAPRYSSEEALVATDDRPHWDDLPPGRRQNYALVAAVGAAAVAAGSAVGVLRIIRRRAAPSQR
jgi:nucleoside-diphosphate-sugar epimerase